MAQQDWSTDAEDGHPAFQVQGLYHRRETLRIGLFLFGCWGPVCWDIRAKYTKGEQTRPTDTICF